MYLAVPVSIRAGDNPTSADNQQERLGNIPENPQRPYANRLARDEEMVRTSRRREEAGRNARPRLKGG